MSGLSGQSEKFSQLVFLQFGTDHAQTACIFRCTFTDLCFFRNHVKVDPCSVFCRKHTLGTKDDTIILRGRKSFQFLLQIFSGVFLNCLTAPACEYLICMMMVMIMVIMSTAAFMIVMMFMVMIVSTAAFVMVVAVMMLMFFMIVIVSAATFVMVVVMVMFVLFMVMVMVFSMLVYMSALRANLFCHQLISQRYRFLHNFQDLLTIQFLDRGSDDGCFLIHATEKFHCLLCFLLIYNICTAHDDRSGIFYLVVKELTEVSHIHLAFLRIHYSCVTVQHDIHIFLNALYCFDHIRKFTYA